MYSRLLYKSLRVNFIVDIRNKFGRFSYIVVTILLIILEDSISRFWNFYVYLLCKYLEIVLMCLFLSVK